MAARRGWSDVKVEPPPAKAIKSIKRIALKIKSPALRRGHEVRVLSDQL